MSQKSIVVIHAISLLILTGCQDRTSTPSSSSAPASNTNALPISSTSTDPTSNPTCLIKPNGTIDPSLDCSRKAVCDGRTDDGPVFAAAMSALNSSGGGLLVPSKTCLVNQTLKITGNRISISCAGGDFTCALTTSNASMPQIEATSTFSDHRGVSNINIRGLILYHTVTPVLGGDAIDFTGWVDNSTIQNVMVYNGYNGVVLGSCSLSWMKNSTVVSTVMDNIVFKPNSGAHGYQTQWNLDSIGTGGAGRFGIYVTSAGVPTQGSAPGDTNQPWGTIVGPSWHNIQAWDNGLGSLSVQAAPGVPINGLQITNSWFCCSKAGGAEVSLYTLGGRGISINNSAIEISPGDGIQIDGTTT